MRSISSLKRSLAKVRRLWLARKYAPAFAEVEHLRKEWPDNPHLLVMWADLLQLQDKDHGPSLQQAKLSYQRAIDLDAQSPEALVGLGHYLYAMDDDNKGAHACFAKAIALCRNWLRETLLAQAKVLNELGRQQEAFACLAEAHLVSQSNGRTANDANGQEILDQFEELRRAE